MLGGTPQKRERLGALLRQFRKEAGLRQADLAQKLGKPQSYISKFESGEKNLGILEAKEICDAMEVRLSDLIKKLEQLG